MVRSVGIEPGDDAIRVVELDGTYKKVRLLRASETAHAAGADATAKAASLAEVVGAAVAAGMRAEATLGHPCREAVLRGLELPFQGRERLQKVVKAEVEGEIHGYVVDDMVVDFHEIAAVDTGSKLLVAAVPKVGIRANLEALAKQKVEPDVVDLDTMALWRAAHWAGAFGPPAAAAAAPGSGQLTAVLDIGARTVKVLLVDGEHLIDMRVVRGGEGATAEAMAARHGITVAQASEAVARCVATGADVEITVEEAMPAPADAAEPSVATTTTRKVTLESEEVAAAQLQFVSRLARELNRYLTSVPRAAAIRAVWLTGMGARVAGVREMISEVFGAEPRELDLLGALSHQLSAEDAARLGPNLATAIGLALGRMGGPRGFNLRQEDLVVQRGFERVKFPLAIACMVAMLLLLVHGFGLTAELRNLEYEIGRTFVDPKKPNAPPAFHGMLHSVLGGKWFENGSQFRLEQSGGKDYTYKDLVAELAATPVHKRLLLVRDKLRLVADQKQKESGVYEDISLESGLAVLVRWAQLLKEIEPQLGRYLLLKVSLDMKSNEPFLEFIVAFRGQDFRDRYNALQLAIEAEFEKPDSPFVKSGARAVSKEELFRDTAESNVPGSYYTIRMGVKKTFAPFGPSQPETRKA